ncbi:hypothetical protein [Haloferula sp. A504]|uniref:hypothetical protein n=1 Tax=Haloferula sp. A504 TaxID=3373601 RepID=UPI0031C8C61A|nr:hypothetical protein [Verrucomicrobiaceae bacterium E54]
MLASIFIEPWESVYMVFLYPGCAIWAAGMVWSLRRRNLRGALLLQIIGAIEVAIGAGAAYVTGLNGTASLLETSGQFNPMQIAGEHRYMSAVCLIGYALHWVLLAMTLLVALIVRRLRAARFPKD